MGWRKSSDFQGKKKEVSTAKPLVVPVLLLVVAPFSSSIYACGGDVHVAAESSYNGYGEEEF